MILGSCKIASHSSTSNPQPLARTRLQPIPMRRTHPIGDNPPVSLDWKSGPLAEGLACFRSAEFFLAHEHWESAWLTLEGPERTFLQAMIQVTVALHHQQSGNRAGALSLLKRWWHARHAVATAGERTAPGRAPVIMVAVDTAHPQDERHPVLHEATAQLMALSAEFRLICVSVVHGIPVIETEGRAESASGIQLDHLARLRNWVRPLDLPPQRLSLHVIESPRPGEALLDFARANHVDLIVLGAPAPGQLGIAWWRSVASTVTANAPCSVYVVRVPRTRGAEDSPADPSDAAEGGTAA